MNADGGARRCEPTGPKGRGRAGRPLFLRSPHPQRALWIKRVLKSEWVNKMKVEATALGARVTSVSGTRSGGSMGHSPARAEPAALDRCPPTSTDAQTGGGADARVGAPGGAILPIG